MRAHRISPFCAAWLVLIAASQGFAAPGACPAPQPLSNMRLTFDSEFAAEGMLKPDQWRIFIGQHGPPDQEAEVYIPDNVTVLPKVGLRLEMAKRTYWDHPYTAGWVGTQGLFSQTYGHFEMLAKMPQANGNWPAMWLVPETGTWPPEIDVVEWVYAPRGKQPDKNVKGQASVVETTLHWADASGQHKFMHAELGSDQPKFRVYDWDKTPPLRGLSADYAGYHIYGIDWRPGSLVWLVDNKPVFCMLDNASTGDRVPQTPMYMILSESVSPASPAKPHWSGFVESNQAFPLDFDIAYTRAYQYKDIQTEHVLALDIHDVTVSNPTPAPGDTITLAATLKVGPSDLGKGKLTFSIYDFLDPHQFSGVRSQLAAMDIQVPMLAANQSYPLKATYKIPRDLPPGFYGVDAKAGYTEGPGNDQVGPWPRGLRFKQAVTFTVTAH
jgi:beta-glucanase (GH16 family)